MISSTSVSEKIGINTYFVHIHTLLYIRMIHMHIILYTHTYMYAYTSMEYPTPYRANFKVTPNIPTKIEK